MRFNESICAVRTTGRTSSVVFRRLALTLFSLALLGTTPNAVAAVKPGEMITAKNATKVKGLLSPGVYYKVVNGMSMKIVPTARIDWPPPYKDATEKYSAQVRLSNDGRTLVGYVAGDPFPLIDANDPNVATKIAWNNVFRPLFTDDYDLRFYDCDTTYEAAHPQTSQIDYFQIGHYAGYSLVGRTEVEPMPVDPDFKNTGRYWLFALYPTLAPQELRGAGFIRYRYADPARGDDSWSWTPGARRVRRETETIMSSATGAYSWDPDHYSGFNAKVEQYNWRFLGEKQMLAVVHAEHSPEVRCATDNGASACPEAWEMRHMYVVEASPRRDIREARGALDSKTVLYSDSEVLYPTYVDTYDQRGQLFRSHIYWLANRDRPVPDARVAIYPFKREFVVGAVSTDIQSGQATMCYLPGIETPERECWYINMGAVDKDFFTTDAMVKAAP
ncbi:MAG TPA: DUF1329 domain-containing protein [Candidatus Binataceae bacterium]|nr:DUF1329 domain-containing protein [Candidatus Binataceae bacterium]